MKHYRIRTETAVIGSNLPCAVCGERSSDLAIVPIGTPPLVGVHKRCVNKLHRKRGGEETEEAAPVAAVIPAVPKASTTPEVPEIPEHRSVLIRRAIAEKILPEGLPQEQAWTRLLNAAPAGWFKKNQTLPGERIDLLHLGLAERGVKMTLPDLCAWSVTRRDVARAWLEQGGDRPVFFPSACAACDGGTPNDKENGYKHTGEGPGCRKGFCPKCGVEMSGAACDCESAEPSFVEQGALCPTCGKPVPERHASRVKNVLYCSAKCALPKGLAAVSAAERTAPMFQESPQAVRRFEF